MPSHFCSGEPESCLVMPSEIYSSLPKSVQTLSYLWVPSSDRSDAPSDSVYL